MILLVAGATVDVAATDPRHVGVLVHPDAAPVRRLLVGRAWGVDNAAFGDKFNPRAYRHRLATLRRVPGCRFVCAPDVVGDAAATRVLFDVWAPWLRSQGWPVALVAQDGLELASVPWDQMDALFIGGTTAWKLSPTVDALLAAAGERGLWRHVGRVNTRRRIRHFARRAESFDGSGFSQWPKRIRLATRWLAQHRLGLELP